MSLGYKKCYQCGGENASDRQFCGVCGSDLDAQAFIAQLKHDLNNAKQVAKSYKELYDLLKVKQQVKHDNSGS